MPCKVENMRLKIVCLSVFVCLSAMLPAAGYLPTTVPNPKRMGNDFFVSNPDGILSDATETKLNIMLSDLHQRSEVEVAVVALNSIDLPDYTEFAYELFRYWKIGQAGKDNGLLLLLVADERAVRIETGYGLEGLLPDAVCNRILTEYMFPAFKVGDYDTGFLAGVGEICQLLTTQDALEELLLDQSGVSDTSAVSILMIYLMLAFAVWICLIWFVYRRLAVNPDASNNVRYQRLQFPYQWSVLFAVLFPFPVAFFAWWLKRRREAVRHAPVRCNECGAKMVLLSEQDEDRYLTAAQQSEETVESVDYDVWECKSCFNHIILPYEKQGSKYGKCPHCHAKTYNLYSDVVRIRATQFREGMGEKTYLCRHCQHRHVQAYTIPKLPVVVAGGVGGGRGSGGGFSGGSWGGGFSGGGGAGGRF